MRRLRRLRPPAPPDPRPALLSVVALLFLLLPFLLFTTSLQRLTGLGLLLAAHDERTAEPSVGLVEAVEVRLAGAALTCRAAVRTLDVTAGPGDVTWSEQVLPPRGNPPEPDLPALQDWIRQLQRQDPGLRRVVLRPDDPARTARVVAVVDALRGDPARPLVEEVVLPPEEDTP